jgi:nucleotide-binding universal stress UspA family protein
MTDPRPTTILAVVPEHGGDTVRRRAIELAQQRRAALIFYDAEAGDSMLADPLPNQWSGHGEEELFGERLSANDLEAAGRAPLARQVREAEAAGVQAWGWLPSDGKPESLREYAARHGASTVVVARGTKLGDTLAGGGRGDGDRRIEVITEGG